jgi:tRNA-modifying protein YgfZ
LSIAQLTRYGLLHASGEDAGAFLHAQLTNDVEHLLPGEARYAGWCTAKGRLLATMLVVAATDGFYLQLSRDVAPAVAKRLGMFILRSKVKLVDLSGSWHQTGLWGDGAAGTLQALGFVLPARPLAASEAPERIAIRIDSDRYLVLSKESIQDASASEADWSLAEVRAGRALISQATQDQFVPQMVNLELSGGVDFRKGCYPGQEIVARAQYRGAVKRRMYRLRGASLQPGQPLYGDDAPDEPAGMVVDGAGGEALAVLPIATVDAGTVLRAKSQAPALELLPLPYAP